MEINVHDVKNRLIFFIYDKSVWNYVKHIVNQAKIRYITNTLHLFAC